METAIHKIDEQCDCFLHRIAEAGVDISKVSMNDLSIDQRKVSNDTPGEPIRLVVQANKKIMISAPFHMAFINFIKNVIKDNQMDADFSTRFSFSDVDSLHKKLLREAIEDSKSKAEIIASAMGQKIIGIEEVSSDIHSGCNIEENDSIQMSDIFAVLDNHSISDQLSAKRTTVSERVEVIWIMA